VLSKSGEPPLIKNPGEQAVYTVVAENKGGNTATATVVTDSATGSVVHNTARVSEAGFDPDPSDNESLAALEVEPLSDLAVTKTTAVGAVRPGQDTTYQIKAENHGPTSNTGVEVVDTLPAGLE
jgi:uncharacterized repeat protein (TIGR01451 family)